MKTFNRYLQLKGFAVNTILQHERNSDVFLRWLITNSKDILYCRYSDIVQFIDQSILLRNIKSQARNLTNRILTSISYYYDFLSERNPSLLNPAKTLRIKGNHTRLRQKPIKYEDMIALYRQNSSNTPRAIRNQVILGFLIFQGMTVRELINLKVDDIKLREGMVVVRESASKTLKRGPTTRVLTLDAVQVIDILTYLKDIRPKILSGKIPDNPGKKPGRGMRLRRTERMVFSLNGSPFIKNTLHHLFNRVKKSNPDITNAKKIRQSVITYWLTKFDLRKVQYMAGHRFVSSTEWYKPDNLEELIREINMYHPLK